jgi:hypothetical protein
MPEPNPSIRRLCYTDSTLLRQQQYSSTFFFKADRIDLKGEESDTTSGDGGEAHAKGVGGALEGAG